MARDLGLRRTATARYAVSLALAGALGLSVPGGRLAQAWPLRHSEFAADSISRFVERAAALGEGIPRDPILFISDSTDPGARAYHYYQVQHALAPRKVLDARLDDLDPRTCTAGLVWLGSPTSRRAVGTDDRLRVVAEAEELLLVEVCPP